MASDSTKTLAKGTAWGVLSGFFLKSVGWIYTIFLARVASQNDIGMFSLVLSVLSVILVFSDIGLGVGAISRYVPFYAGKGEYNHVRSVIRISLIAGTISSFICTAAIILYSQNLSSSFQNPQLATLFYLMSAFLLVNNFAAIEGSFLTGRKLMKRSSSLGSAQGLSKLVFTVIVFLIAGLNAYTIAIAFLLSYVIQMILGFFWSYNEYERLPASDDKPDTYALLKEMVPFGLMLTVLGSMYTVNANFDRILIGYLMPGVGNQMNAIYTMAIGLCYVIPLFAAPIASIFLPVISEAWGRKDGKEIEHCSATFLRWTALSTTPIILVFLLIPSEILTLLYGVSYAGGATSLALYATGVFISLFAAPISYVYSAMRRLGILIKIAFVGMLINVALNWLLIPLYGINGSALGSAVSFIATTILFILIRRKAYVSIPKDFYKPFAAGLATLVILFLAKHLFSLSFVAFSDIGAVNGMGAYTIASDLLRKALKVSLIGGIAVVVCLVYAGFIIVLKALHREDKEIILSGLKRLKAPHNAIRAVEKLIGP